MKPRRKRIKKYLVLFAYVLLLILALVANAKKFERRWRCPKGMILIPGGDFNMIWTGERWNGYKNESVWIGSFCIDQYEYPNIVGEFALTKVNFTEAEHLCEADSKRLCSQFEWQKACQGPDGFIFPYGDKASYQICNTQIGGVGPGNISPIGSFKYCISGYGVHDMSGGVSEWVSDLWEENSKDRVLKGGSYNENYNNRQEFVNGRWQFKRISNSCDAVHHHSQSNLVEDDGFRCCKEPKKTFFG